MSCESNCGPLTVTLLTGAPGVQGPQGVQGPEGPAGPQGPQGPAGSVGTVTGDMSITTEGVATLATVGVAAVVGGAAKALTLQVDEKGRVLAVTAQDASITTSQVQNLSLATLGGVATTDPRLTDARTPTGAASGDLSGTYPAPTLATVGVAGVTGEADKTLVLQTDAKGRAVAVTAQAISITTSQVQNLSLATLGGVATTDPRLSDARIPTGTAGGDLSGTYPNPTLGTVGTAGVTGAADKTLLLQTDTKGRVLAATAQAISVTTSQVQNLSLATLGGVSTTDPRLSDSRTPSGAAGGDLAGTYPNPTLGTVTTAGSVGSATVVPVVTIDAKGRVTALGSAQIAALTTAQVAGLSTATPAAIATTGAVGVEMFAARADHVHALTTLGVPGTFGSASAVPVVTVDAFGRVASVTTAEITGGGGVSLTTEPAYALATAGVAGLSTEAARADHQHPIAGDVVPSGISGSVTVSGVQGVPIVSGTPGAFGAVLVGDGSNLKWEALTGDVIAIQQAAALTVTGLHGRVISPDAPGVGDTLVWQGTMWGAQNLNVPSAGTANPSSVSTVSQVGTSANFAREDHVHTLEFFEYTPEYIKSTPNAGTSSYPARSDHAHALTTLGTAGTFGSGSVVPILTVDEFGRVASVTTAEVSSAGVTTTGLAPLESPALTGTPTAPTASAGTNSTQIATTAFVASNSGDRYKTTSDSTATIGNGTKTFSVASGLSYSPTQDVTVIADVDNHMHGTVVSYSGTTLVVEVTQHTGSGTFSSWTINVGGLTTTAGALLASNNLSDVASVATARTNLGAVGTARQVSAGTGLSGGGDLTADRTLSLAASGVAAGNYGGASAVPVLTVDTYGRLTNVTTAQAAALTTNDIRGLSTVEGAALTTAGVVGLSLFAARADHSHKVATIYARTKTVGVDAATIQGCIDLITDASATNQAQVVVPPGYYVENLTLKPCVSVVASGANNGQISTVRIVGNATFTGGAIAADNTLQLVGLSFNTNHATLPALTVAASGGVTTLLHVQDCMVISSNAASTAVGIQVGINCSARLVNVRTQGNTTAGQGGTHVDVDGGTFYAENWTTEYGTRALLMRGTNGALKPYGELKWSNISVSGANAIEITSATALLTMGWVSVGNLATTGNGINVAAGSVVGATQCVFSVQAGASNYVVTGAVGSYYYSLGNSYSNATGAPYETKIGASVTQFQYARSYDPASGDLTGSFPAPTLAAVTTAQSNVGSATAIPRLSIDAKGRVTALSTVAVSALTTAQLAGLSTATPAVLATTGAVGTSLFAARADHVHALATIGTPGTFGDSSVVPIITLDAFGRVAALTTTAISGGGGGVALTTADAAPLGAVASAGISNFAAHGDHVHPLPTAAQIGALTTTQILGLSTATPAVLTTTGVVGLSTYAARADHSHAMTTAATAPLFSGTAPSALGTTASAGGSPFVARADHRHIYPTPAQIGAIATTGTVKLTIDTVAASVSPLNLVPAVVPTTKATGDLFVYAEGSRYVLGFQSNLENTPLAGWNFPNTFSRGQTISALTEIGLKITQTGNFDCFKVEDSTSPDATPFVINKDGRVGVGVAPDAAAAITLDGGGIKIANAGATAFCTVTVGAGSPEGVVTADPGSLFLNTSGGSGTSLYVKESGAGNTGWVGK